MKISEDKKTITLPVPLGSTVWTFKTDCDNHCYRDDDGRIRVPSKDAAAIKERNKRMNYFCCHDAKCHTLYKGTLSKELCLQNLYIVMNGWGTEWFATKAEADAAGKALVAEHRLCLQCHGIPVKTDATEKYDFLNNFDPAKMQEYIDAVKGEQPHADDTQLQG